MYADNDPINGSDPLGLQREVRRCIRGHYRDPGPGEGILIDWVCDEWSRDLANPFSPNFGNRGFIPSGIVDFSAGFGDALLLGTGPALRRALNIETVDRCAGAYSAGGWTSFGLGASRVAYAGAAKGISIFAATGAEASAMRESLKQFFRFGARTSFRQPDLARYPTDEALRAAAGGTNPLINTYGAGVGAAGAVGGVGLGCQ